MKYLEEIQFDLSPDDISDAATYLIEQRIINYGKLADGEILKTDAGKRDGRFYSAKGKKRNYHNVDLYISGSFFNSMLFKNENGKNILVAKQPLANYIASKFKQTFDDGNDFLEQIGELTQDEKEMIMELILKKQKNINV